MTKKADEVVDPKSAEGRKALGEKYQRYKKGAEKVKAAEAKAKPEDEK